MSDVTERVRPLQVLSLGETAWGGVGTYLRLMDQMSPDEVRHRAVAPAQHTAMLQDISARSFDRPKRGVRALTSMLRAFLAERRANPPDLFMFHSSFALLGLVALWLLREKKPAIYCAHGWAATNYPQGTWKHRVVRVVEGWFCGLATVVVNVSTAQQRFAERSGYRGCHVVVENAVQDRVGPADVDRFGKDPDKTNLLFVGRFDRQKGLDLLFQAFAEAHAVRDDLRLYVIGDTVREGAALKDAPDGVFVSGWVDPNEIDAWYGSADAVIVPSRWEGLPLVIPEALRNGTPVFCSDRSGMPDLVEPGKTGGSFQLDIASVRECLIGLDKANLRAMRPACRRAYETRFSAKRLHEELSKLFDELVGAAK